MVSNSSLNSKQVFKSNEFPLVSIIITNYNYEFFLAEAIDSVLKQTYQNIEVIIVDDGSTDKSKEIIDSYGDQVISIFKNNEGQCSSYNIGFAKSKGEIICFLDADDIFLPEKVAEVVEIFQSSEEIYWCFHNLRWIDKNSQFLPEISTQRLTCECDFRYLLKSGKLPPTLPASSALCFRRSLLAKILPMPIDQALLCSDFYVKYMAVALEKGSFLGKVLAFHRIHGQNAATLRKDKQDMKAREYIFTGIWISKEFNQLNKFANKLVSVGISKNWRIGKKDYINSQAIKNYLLNRSLLDKVKINLIAMYYSSNFLPLLKGLFKG